MREFNLLAKIVSAVLLIWLVGVMLVIAVVPAVLASGGSVAVGVLIFLVIFAGEVWLVRLIMRALDWGTDRVLDDLNRRFPRQR